MKDVEYLKKLYLSRARIKLDNEWVQIAKKNEELFDNLAKILDEKEMPYEDYIEYHFSHSKGYPSAKYITSPNAVMRYEVHQKMTNKYVNEDYAIDEEDFYVNKTHRKYPLSQVKLGAAQDADSNYALTMAEQEDCKITQDLCEAVEYTICKFRFKFKVPPIQLVKLSSRCRNK